MESGGEKRKAIHWEDAQKPVLVPPLGGLCTGVVAAGGMCHPPGTSPLFQELWFGL